MKHTRIVALDHISLAVRQFKKARAFYEAPLGAIGMKVNMEFADACGARRPRRRRESARRSD